ncbi:HAD family phosphatase [Patulibacter sp.]|uniref:HAD family hydrolase n=1 Tax=Patulibacter sp. TaxID=1912859 RepID=UPI0027236688|nr:HAD family phosphatase [Patulibacter sp.]MDO9408645.1 HAD family phosphatase [Patulibacter sp.]
MPSAASAAVLRPAAVVFDNDGTFLETESVWSRAEEELFRRRGLPFLAEHKLELIGTSFVHASESLERFLGEPGGGPAIMEELVDLVHRELDGEVPVMPGAERLVDALRAEGIQVAMATNAARGFAEKALHRAGHADTFPVLLTAEDVVDPKPAPDIYLAAAAALGVDPADCVAVEDSPTGVRSAVAAGMTVLGVTSFPGVDLSHAHHRHPSLEDPALWALLGLDGD